MFENADLYRTIWQKGYFDALSCYHLENWRTFKPQVINDFPAVSNYGKWSAKFLVSRIGDIDTVRFCSFLQVLLE